MTKQLTCTERVETAKDSRIADLKAFMASDDLELEDGTQLGDYALSWDYVEPDTFEDQPNGYYRYQISFGGPSEEIRYHVDAEDVPKGGLIRVQKVEFWFLDWFDGACVELTGDDLVVALWVAEMHIG